MTKTNRSRQENGFGRTAADGNLSFRSSASDFVNDPDGFFNRLKACYRGNIVSFENRDEKKPYLQEIEETKAQCEWLGHPYD